VVIATGATARRLGIPSEHEFWSRGISACAICDGASPIFKNKELGVVGGGDSATEEAVYLTKYGKHVHLFVRGEKMRASKAMQDRVLQNPKVRVPVTMLVNHGPCPRVPCLTARERTKPALGKTGQQQPCRRARAGVVEVGRLVPTQRPLAVGPSSPASVGAGGGAGLGALRAGGGRTAAVAAAAGDGALQQHASGRVP